jgi:hypothetical protein
LALVATLASVVAATALVVGSQPAAQAPIASARPSTAINGASALTPRPSIPTRSQPGDVLRVIGPDLGDAIEAYRDDLLYVADVTTDRGHAAYLIEGPPRSAAEDASRVTVVAATIDASTRETKLVCPGPPASISELEYLAPFVRAVCFQRELTLEDVWLEQATVGERQSDRSQGTLSGFAEPGSGTLPYSLAPGVTVDADAWVTVTGRFGQAHPVCGDAFGILRCRERFVVERISPGTSPFADLPGVWSRMSAAPIDGRSSYVALETDRGIFIWGGEPEITGSQPAIYEPRSDRWSKGSTSPEAGRVAVASAWSGDEVLMWGGSHEATLYDDGLTYDPAADHWRRIPPSPILAGYGEGAWTGSEFLVVSSMAEAAAWDPVTPGWRRLPDPPLPKGAMESVWTGTEFVVLALGDGDREPILGAALDPLTSSWRPIAEVPYDGLMLGVSPIWTHRRMLFVGHAYDPVADRWDVLRRDGCPYRYVSDGVWTGRYVMNQTQAYDVGRGRCYTLPESPERPAFEGVQAHEFHTPVWADGRLVVWSGGTGLDGPGAPPDGIAFTPAD